MQLTDRYGNIVSDLLVVSGSYVTNVSNVTSIAMHTLSNIKNLFKEKYGLTPTSNNTYDYTAMYSNGDGNAVSAHFDAPTIINNQFYCVLAERSGTGNIRVNYMYLYDVSKGVE